jgi:hypothetical protein
VSRIWPDGVDRDKRTNGARAPEPRPDCDKGISAVRMTLWWTAGFCNSGHSPTLCPSGSNRLKAVGTRTHPRRMPPSTSITDPVTNRPPNRARNIGRVTPARHP